MKKILFTLALLVSFSSFGQYSSYYGYNRVDANVKVESNVNATINKTVKTIDYGALRLANAEKEKNRLASLKYSDTKQKNQALEIAIDPQKAFDYGKDNSWRMNSKRAKSYGFSNGTIYYHKIPNKSLFASTGNYSYRNESESGVVTEIELGSPYYVFGTTSFLDLKKKERNKIIEKWQPYLGKTEERVKSQMATLKVGELKEGTFTHKKDINKSKVFGKEGFVSSWFYEDDYELVIKDNFEFISSNGVIYKAGVRYRGDKDEVTFEMLEGRRSYFKKLCAQIIATANIKLGYRGLND